MDKSNIAIIGGGIAGLTTALALKKLNIPCRVFEKAPQLNEVGAGIMMQPNALKVFDWLNIGDRVRSVGMYLDRVEITNPDLRPIRKSNSAFITDPLGNKIIAIHRGRLQQILFDALPSQIVHLNKEYQGHHIESDKVIVSFQDSSLESDLLIGADGINSRVRKHLFPNASTRFSGQTSWRGIAQINLSDKHRSSAKEAWGNKIRFGLASISETEVYWFAVINSLPNKKDNIATLKQDLINTFKDFDSVVSEIIDATPVEKIIKSDISDLKRLDSWHKDSVCLIGDAAHATTPNMGQGGGQGVEDAYYLSNILSKIPDYNNAFKMFEKERRKKVDYVVKTSWQIGKMAHNPISQPLLKFALKITPTNMMIRQMQELYSIKEVFDY